MAESAALPWPAPYCHLRRRAEWGFWLVILGVNGVFNALLTSMELRSANRPFAPWEPWFWESSSALVVGALIPAVVALERRFPLHWDTLRRHLPVHVLGSMVYCSLHLAGLMALRKLGYAALGHEYELDGWWAKWGYEYLKDARSYALVLSALVSYRFVLLRLQGEARVLDAPDPVAATAPLDPGHDTGRRAAAAEVSSLAPAETAPAPCADSVQPWAPPPSTAASRPERFLVRKLRREFLIAASDIAWVQAQANYVGLRVNGHDYLLRSTLSDFLDQLDPARFVRVHRSYAVNLDAVAEIEPLDSGDARLTMKDGSTVPCSRRYRSALAPGA